MQKQPVLSAAEMRAAEQKFFDDGNDSFALMQVAAGAVAERAATMAPDGGRILVLAGPGNNGGDGHLAAAMLASRGFDVHVRRFGEASGADAIRAAKAWSGPTGQADPVRFDLIIDALFGIGLARPLSGEAATLVEAVNASGRPILAVDIASGVNADSGDVTGPAIRATATITFHSAKPGHLLLPGRHHAGRLLIVDIGLPPTRSQLFENSPALWQLPRPQANTHKYARGAALVWSGPELATGASRLAAQAALRVGAGAVTLAGAREALLVQAAHVTAVMLAEADAPKFGELLAGEKLRAACVGPGAGPMARAVAIGALEAGKALVLDADALTAFAPDVAHLARLVRRHPRPVVLTPHEGEFRRLFPETPDGSRLSRAKAAAELSGATVIFKGSDGVIACPTGRAAIVTNAPPWLATAGSGDVLAGYVTGLLAQGMAAFEAACAAAWIHAEMGNRLGPGLIAEDLCGPEMRAALAAL